MPWSRRTPRRRQPARPPFVPSLLLPALFAILAFPVIPTVVPTASADPFAPPGTVLIRVDVPDRSVWEGLQKLGLHPEEGGRDWLEFRVPEERVAELRALGYSLRVMDTGTGPMPVEGAPGGVAAFTTYDQMAAELAQLAADYPSLTTLESCGQTVQGREIWALEVTRNAGVEEAEPEFRVVGAHHGNERMSAEIALDLAHLLLESYGTDSTVTALVDSRETWIVPMVNPDGVVAGSRYNAHGVDLNRNYGYMWEGGGSSAWSEPETRAMYQLGTDHVFIIGLSFHTSGDVVNSPWNYSPIYTEDDDVIWTLTQGYAAFNGYWAVRGWYWYETHGDCNDWSYGARAALDWTIEVSNTDETTVWNKNRPAILYMMDAAGWGIHGIVTDALSGDPLLARVRVEGNGWPAFTDPDVGDYHKPLLGGSYTVRVSANGYADEVIPGVVVPVGGQTTLDVSLTPGGGHYAAQVEEANVADLADMHNNLTLTMSVLGAPDGVGCSLGRSGSAILTFGAGSEPHDLPGDDLTVFESTEDATVEGYAVYAGPSYRGPWTLVGNGMGTASFDLAGTGLSKANFVRVVDDGDGSATTPNAGFELDAVESASASLASVGGTQPGTSVLYLAPPSPNPVPAGSVSRIAFRAPADRAVRLEVFDVAGRRVARLADGVSDGRMAEVAWPGNEPGGGELAAGVYFVRLSSGDRTTNRKLLVVPAQR